MELATPTIHKSGNQLHVSHGDDKGLHVTFYIEAIKSPFKSEQAGYPVFEDVTFVHILFPGNRSTEVKRPAKLKNDGGIPPDNERWPRAWQAFQNQSEEAHVGLPVTEWSPLTKGQAMGLKAQHIHTVEQLAELPDHALTWLGAREMQIKAKAYLKQAGDGGAEAMRLSKENDNLHAVIEALKAQISDLAKSKKGEK